MSDTAERPITREDFSKADQAALDKALELTLADHDDDGRPQQVRAIQLESGWYAAAIFCSGIRQSDHLSLSPWESTPSDLDPDEIDAIIARGAPHNHEYGAAVLLKKMLKAGVSRFDPSPIDAIAAARR